MIHLFRNIKPLLALIIIVSCFVFYFVSTFTGKHNDQILIAVVALGSQAAQYYFGNSSGSSKKDDVINTLTNEK